MTDQPASAFVRLFTALAVPPDVRQEIGRIQGRLRRDAPPGLVRWTRSEQFHVTMKYLGDVPLAQMGALEESVSAVCASCPAPDLRARGIGFFPKEYRPRVIWVRVDDPAGKLAEIHRRMDKALQPFAEPDKPETFTGHITLGRFKPGLPPARQAFWDRVSQLRDREFGAWCAGTVEIMRSELTVAGAIHTPLASFPLAQ